MRHRLETQPPPLEARELTPGWAGMDDGMGWSGKAWMTRARLGLYVSPRYIAPSGSVDLPQQKHPHRHRYRHGYIHRLEHDSGATAGHPPNDRMDRHNSFVVMRPDCQSRHIRHASCRDQNASMSAMAVFLFLGAKSAHLKHTRPQEMTLTLLAPRRTLHAAH